MNSDSLNMVSRMGEGHIPCTFFLSEPQLKTTVVSTTDVGDCLPVKILMRLQPNTKSLQEFDYRQNEDTEIFSG